MKIFYTLLKNISRTTAQFVRIFFLLFVGIFLISQRETVKEIFNYKMVYGEIIYAVKTRIAKEIAAELRVPQTNLVPTAEAGGQSATTVSADTILLSIPKLTITAPLLFADNTSEPYLQLLLKQGVVAYPGSSPIGSEGVTVILGHSAPPGWPKIRYDWVFSELNQLRAGDQIQILAEGKEYRYEVTKKFFLNKGQEIPLAAIRDSKSIIILITCWPPGVDYKRIAVQAELR